MTKNWGLPPEASRPGAESSGPPSAQGPGAIGAWPPADLKPMVSLPFVLAPLEALPAAPGPGDPAKGTGAPPRRRRRALVIGLVAAVLALGLIFGAVLVLPRWLGPGEVAAPVGSTSAPVPPPSDPPTPPTTPTSTPAPSQPAGVDLPASDPLQVEEFVVPRTTGTSPQLYVASVAGPVAPRLLKTPTRGRFFGPSLSPDRRTLVYINGEAGILRVMAVDGSGDRALFKTPPDGCEGIRHMSWSQTDPSRMVVDCATAGGADVLMVIDLEGRVVRELPTATERIGDPTVSPDGRLVAFWGSKRGGREGGSLYVVPIDGSADPTKLTSRPVSSDADPAWSPDGSTIAFRRRDAKNSLDVFAMNADGSGVRPLVRSAAVEEKPAWSPDGTQLMVVSNRAAGGKPGKTFDLYLVNADGSGITPLGLSADDISTPCWEHR